MLLVCGGGMRTGSVATFQLLREILEVTGTGHTPEKGMGTPSNIEQWAAEDQWVLYKAHGFYEALRPYANRIYAVVTYRNHLDTILSLMKFREESFEKVMSTHDRYSNITCYDGWVTSLPPEQLFLLRYEDGVIANRQETVQKLAAFLNTSVTPEQAMAMQVKWNIEANRKRAEAHHPLNTRDYMAKRHIYSKGQSLGQKELTPEQIEQVLADPIIAEWQKEMGYLEE